MSFNLTNLLLGRKKKTARATDMLELFSPYFSEKAAAETNATFNSICDAHARHVSKVQFEVTTKGEPSSNKAYIKRLLTLRPNPSMNAATFWETVTKDYFMQNNAFIYLDWDYTDVYRPLKGLYIIEPDGNSMETLVNENTKRVFVRFTLDNDTRVVPLDDICVISRNVKAADLFGQTSPAINQVLKVIQTNNEGIDQAIKSSAFIRFIVQSTTVLNDDVKKKRAAAFAETYLGKDSSGVVYVDAAQNIQQVNSNAKYVDNDLLNAYTKAIYEYLGGSDKITMATFNDEEWQSYFESVLEPLLCKICQELSYKILSEGELDHGNMITFNADGLHTASLKTRAQVATVVQKQPVYKPNVVNDLLGLPRTETGDEEFASLNYVKAKDQTAYQTGKEEDPVEPKEEEEDSANAED